MEPVQNPSRKQRRLRRRGAVILLGLGAFGLAAASAASLGGLTSATLGADNGPVASCDTDGVALTYTNAYDTVSGLYKTTAVTVSNIDPACAGKALDLTLASAAAVQGTGTIASLTAAPSQVVTLSTQADAKLVTQAAVVITG